MFKLPTKFDENEIFIIVIITILLLLFLLLPKKIPIPLVLIIMFFYSFMGKTTDRIIGVRYPYDMYDTLDTGRYDLFDFLLYTTVYPLYGYLFAYFYYKWNLKGILRITYILICAACSVCFEWLAVFFHVYEHKKWNYYYSALVYLATIILIIILLEKIKKWYEVESRQLTNE